MDRLPYLQSIMGTRTRVLRRWQLTKVLQRTTSHMTLSQNHHMVPTQLEDMIEELEERLLWILDGVREVIDDLKDIIDKLECDPSPAPPADFDPLRTIGKYC